jgi:hypothetical protein
MAVRLTRFGVVRRIMTLEEVLNEGKAINLTVENIGEMS